MSDPDFNDAASVASHTLAYLRRIDRRTDEFERRMDGMEKRFIQIADILSRQSIKIDRSDRNNGEGFDRIERELREIKGDALLADNRILDRMSEALELSRRLARHDERLDVLEAASRSSPSSQ